MNVTIEKIIPGFFNESPIFPKMRESNESEKVTAINIIAFRIPKFITRDIGLNFLPLKTSFVYNTRNKKVNNAITSFKAFGRNESFE